MKVKPLFILLFFVLFIGVFAAGAIGSTDLTPDTPPAPTSVVFDAVLFQSGGNTAGRPCGGAYTVRSGDTLTRIAQLCNVPLADLLAANPTILDPHLIREGQVIQIYYAPAPPGTDAPAPPGADAPAPPATDAPAPPEADAPTPSGTDASTAAPAVLQPALLSEPRPEGLRPGGTLNVILKDLPPSSRVQIAIGRAGEQPLLIDERDTDQQGGLTLKLAIPQRAEPGEQWVVTITSADQPQIKVTSVPFVIEK